MSTSKTVAFIGLGVMGGPMAGHLARAGHRVTAYNRSADRAENWRAVWKEEGISILPIHLQRPRKDARWS